jgi:hypothetical protein
VGVSEWIPLASVIASAAVGLGVPFISARNDRERILDQAEQGRLDELRGVIDDAGAAVTAAIFELDRSIDEANAPTPVVEPPLITLARNRQALDAYTERLEGLWAHENRLAVRVRPEDLIYFHYGEAVTALQKPLWVLGGVAAGGVFDKQGRREVAGHRRDALHAQLQFHQAAATRLGIRPPDERRRRLTRRA